MRTELQLPHNYKPSLVLGTNSHYTHACVLVYKRLLSSIVSLVQYIGYCSVMLLTKFPNKYIYFVIHCTAIVLYLGQP